MAATMGCSGSSDQPPGRALEIDLRSSRSGTVRVYLDRGNGLSEQHVVQGTLRDVREHQTVRLPIGGEARRLRLDPFDGPGELTIEGLRLVREPDAPVVIPLRVLATNQILNLSSSGDTMHLRTVEDAVDPWVLLSTPALQSTGILDALLAVTPRSATVVALGLALLIVWSIRETWRHASAPLASRARYALLAGVVGVAALITGSRLWLVDRFGSGVPFLDQWNGEGWAVYLPFLRGELRWPELFAPHNEHRIVLTRVLDLSLFLLNEQWDSVVQMVANAFLYASVGGLVLLLLWRLNGRQYQDVLSAIVLMAWALPFGWENTLTGFQSSFYLLSLLLVLPLSLVPDARPWSTGWVVGLLLLILALFTVGTGLLNPIAVATAVALRYLADRSRRADLRVTFVACLLVAVGGALLRPPVPAYHLGLLAQSVAQFATLAGAMLAWPFVEVPGLAIVTWMPLALTLVIAVRTRTPTNRLEATLVAIGAWVWLHTAAAGYNRGNDSSLPASRYMDVLALGFVANATAAHLLVVRSRAGAVRVISTILAVIWGVGLVGGLTWRAWVSVEREAPGRKASTETYVANVRTYLRTGNARHLRSLKFPAQVPFPDPEFLANVMLEDPDLRQRLPPSLRDPLPLAPSSNENAAFVPDGAYPTTPTDPLITSWGSYSERGNQATGEFVSHPLRCNSGGYLRVDLAGYLGQAGTALDLVESQEKTRHVRPFRSARESWRPTFVSCPEGPFTLKATDSTSSWWFAFRAPVEYGPLSWLAETAARAHLGLLLVGIALCWISVRLWHAEAARQAGPPA